MTRQKPIFVLMTCLTLAVFATSALSRLRIQPTGPDPKRLRGLTDEEASEVIGEWFDDRRLQERTSAHEYLAAMTKQAIKNELRASDGQWRAIEPRYEDFIEVAFSGAWARASNRVGKDFSWIKPTEDKGAGFPLPKTAVELTEAERRIGELIGLLRQEKPDEKELRKRIDALQQARERARKELPKDKRELAAVLTTPRQEAVFLLLGYID